jgi:hypothetical protein
LVGEVERVKRIGERSMLAGIVPMPGASPEYLFAFPAATLERKKNGPPPSATHPVKEFKKI